MKRIVLLGKDGRLGLELQRALAPLAELIALGHHGAQPGAMDGGPIDPAAMSGDLDRPEELGATIRTLGPDVVVNAAAFTAVDRAEDEVEAAEAVNAEAPGELARLCNELGAWLIHFSTDHVFDGSGHRPWREEDTPGPVNTYGRTKLAGEERIRASGCRHLILRCSWLYALRGDDFPDSILRQAFEQEQLRVVDDQIGAPTGADLVADVTSHALRAVAQRPGLGGTFHVAAAGATSRFDYACFVIQHALALGARLKARPERVRAVSSAACPGVARRPHNSLLACDRLERTFGLRMPPWQAGVQRMLREKVLT